MSKGAIEPARSEFQSPIVISFDKLVKFEQNRMIRTTLNLELFDKKKKKKKKKKKLLNYTSKDLHLSLFQNFTTV